MTSATLYREGPDLDGLLADLDAEYPGRVRVIEVLRPREGGVLGFFARQRVGVHYRLTDDAETTPAEPLPSTGSDRSRRSTDGAPGQRAGTGGLGDPGGPGAGEEGGTVAGAEFARLLAELAVRRATDRAAAGDRPATADPVAAGATGSAARPPAWHSRLPRVAAPGAALPSPAKPSAATPARSPAVAPTQSRERPSNAAARSRGADSTGADSTVGAPPAPSAGADRAPGAVASRHTHPLTLRRQLLELGVPVEFVPVDAVHPYAAIEGLIDRLPEPPAPPLADGQILLVAGPATDARVLAEALIAGASINPDQVWSYPCPTDLAVEHPVSESAAQAREIAAEVRRSGTGPTLVVVATDNRPRWSDPVGEIIAALQPDAVWAIVDATRKPADTRAALARLGPVTAIAVTHAQCSASPATVWELDLPIAMLDGRPGTRAAWAVLLLEKLAVLEQACSDAQS